MPDHDFRHLLFLKKSEGRLNSKSLPVEKLTKNKIFFLNRVTAFRGEKCEKGCEGIKKVNRIKRLTQVERMREREREREKLALTESIQEDIRSLVICNLTPPIITNMVSP